MSWFRITLHRSAIGLPERTHGVLKALGLRRRSQVVFHPVEAQFAGMIMKVKELVKVEEVDRPMTKWEIKNERRPDPGFYIERAVPRDASAAASVLKAVRELSAAAAQKAGEVQGDEEVRL